MGCSEETVAERESRGLASETVTTEAGLEPKAASSCWASPADEKGPGVAKMPLNRGVRLEFSLRRGSRVGKPEPDTKEQRREDWIRTSLFRESLDRRRRTGQLTATGINKEAGPLKSSPEAPE